MIDSSDFREIAATETLLVALDFDGTLAPEVDDPKDARAIPEARAAVVRLLEIPRTRVALVSGRALESLEEVSGFPASVLLVGSHGIEIRLDNADDVLGLSAEERQRVDALGRLLGRVAESFDRVWVEAKPAGFALHTRLATEEHSREAHAGALRQTEAELPELTVRHGKNVLEFSVRSTTKGDAVEHLRDYTSATAVLYAGDDVTDEDVFGSLRPGDFGLKSGDGPTVAQHRVAGPRQVADVLALLADLREGATPNAPRRKS